MAAGRYAAICRPLQARHLVGAKATRIAVVGTFLVWTVLELPKAWTYGVVKVECSGVGSGSTGEPVIDYYILDEGYLVVHSGFKTAFTYIWASLGFWAPSCCSSLRFFLPVVTLAYCNVHLVRALRESLRVRRLYRVSPRATSPGSRISPTLVAIVCMYLVLITPSELLHFYYYAIGRDDVTRCVTTSRGWR
jgi:hypothetical protein